MARPSEGSHLVTTNGHFFQERQENVDLNLEESTH